MEGLWQKMREDMENLAEMDAVREIAESYYDAASLQVKDQAYRFFIEMDLNKDGLVNVEEFLKFMRAEGYTHMKNNSFFKMLDTNGRGTLTFMDVMTLYYIIKSGRPFCGGCRKFIPGTFFSCVICFNHRQISFSICRHCHKSKNYDHDHNGRRPLFLDNFTLLQATRHNSSTTSSNKGRKQNSATPTAYTMNNELQCRNGSTVTTGAGPSRRQNQNAIVPANRRGHWWWGPARDALEALDNLITFGNFVAAVSTSSCAIM